MFSRTRCPPALTPPRVAFHLGVWCPDFLCISSFSADVLPVFAFLWAASTRTYCWEELVFLRLGGITASVAIMHVENDGIYHYIERFSFMLTTSRWVHWACVHSDRKLKLDSNLCCYQETYQVCVHGEISHTQVYWEDHFLLSGFISCHGLHSTSCFCLISCTIQTTVIQERMASGHQQTSKTWFAILYPCPHGLGRALWAACCCSRGYWHRLLEWVGLVFAFKDRPVFLMAEHIYSALVKHLPHREVNHLWSLTSPSSSTLSTDWNANKCRPRLLFNVNVSLLEVRFK